MVVFVTHLDRGIAVIVVDLVNDFVSGKFGSERGIEVAGNTAKFLKILNGRYPVIFTLDTHVPGDPEFKVWGEHCLEGTKGSELDSSLVDIDGYRIRKRHYDSFYDSDLDGILRMHGISHVYVSGISTDICVQHTVAGAFFRNLQITVIEDLCATIDPDNHVLSIKAMKRNYGVKVITLAEAEKELT